MPRPIERSDGAKLAVGSGTVGAFAAAVLAALVGFLILASIVGTSTVAVLDSPEREAQAGSSTDR